MLFTACNNEDTPIQPKPKAIYVTHRAQFL